MNWNVLNYKYCNLIGTPKFLSLAQEFHQTPFPLALACLARDYDIERVGSGHEIETSFFVFARSRASGWGLSGIAALNLRAALADVAVLCDHGAV